MSVQKELRLRIAPAVPGRHVLDVGCGTGADLQFYARAGCHVHGVDVSPTMLKVARKRLGEQADLKLCNAAQMPFQNESFDLILASYTLHEMPFELRPAVVEEMTRVVKPDGRILLTDFLSGPYEFPKGWVDAAFRYFYERMAGRAHFRNGRDFLMRGGLKALVARSSLKVKKRFFPKGGTLAFYLLGKVESAEEDGA
jgi:ubiquinone/menaquinone biosynthesis C-methylase UbiE